MELCFPKPFQTCLYSPDSSRPIIYQEYVLRQITNITPFQRQAYEILWSWGGAGPIAYLEAYGNLITANSLPIP